ncbi:MAG: alkaline phosphatase family protein [Spirochaetia bacterium]|nr:alkaline phosphatase family protein [Spirochaetia bacterium]
MIVMMNQQTLSKITFGLFLHLSFLFAQADWQWSGAVEKDRAVVVAGVNPKAAKLRLVVSRKSDLSEPLFFEAVTRQAEGRTARFLAQGLKPSTLWYYAVEVDGRLPTDAKKIGSFKTFPEGPASFTFAMGACSSEQNHKVFGRIVEKDPLFFLFDGDFHYANPNGPDVETHRKAYETRVFSGTDQEEMLRRMSVAYVWDDHDYSGNDSDGSSKGRDFARRAFREYVPHFALPAGEGGAIYQSFTVGRLRVIMSDVRSERENGKVMSPAQRSWFEKEVLKAVADRQMIAWVTTYGWNGKIADNWGGFPEERTSLSDFFRSAGASNLMIFSGDSHMLAIDDGANCDFTSGKNGYAWPLFHAAALVNKGSTKGVTGNVLSPAQNITYSNESGSSKIVRSGQYGLVTVTDTGGKEMTISFRAMRVHPLTGEEEELKKFEFKRSL